MKKTNKSIISLILTLLMMFSCVTPAFAANSAQSQSEDTAALVSVKVTADKTDYEIDEKITFTVELSNDNKFAVKNVTALNLADMSLKFDGDSTIKVKRMEAGEKVTKTIVAANRDAIDFGNTDVNDAFSVIFEVINTIRRVFGIVLAPFFANIDACDVNMNGEVVGVLTMVNAFVADSAAPDTPDEPEDPDEPETYEYTVRFNSNGGSKVNAQIVGIGDRVEEPKAPKYDGFEFKGWYTDAECTEAYDFDTPVAKSFTLYAKWEKAVAADPNDADGDGLSDEAEDAFGTDKNKPDTDGDGFTDYEEVMLMGTDPLVVNDSSADTDEDGLTDEQEVKTYGTDINAADTDNDGLSDYDEVKTYGTDPLKEDTDGDGLSDGFEVANGLDPKKVSTDGETNDGDVKIEQETTDEAISSVLNDDSNVAKPEVSGEAAGELSENVFIASSDDSAFDDNRAVVGMPVFVNGEDDYLNGLTLSFDLSGYEGDLNNLAIVELDEDGNFKAVESSKLEGTKLSCQLDGSGTYCVLDLEEFLKNLGIDLSSYASAATYSETELVARESLSAEALFVGGTETTVSGQADIVFAIDTTGSMYNTIRNVVNNVTSFVTTLSEDYNVKVNFALIDFKDLEEDGYDTTVVVKNGSSNWFSDVEDFKDKVDDLYADGGGDELECDIDALETARRLDFRSSANKFIILITDTTYKVLNRYGVKSLDEEIELLKKDGINTSVVSNTWYQDDYKNLYESTNGVFVDIYSNFADALLKLADLIGEITSDGEWVILKHGYKYVKLTDDKDQDGDGLSTEYELGEKQEIDLTWMIKAQLANNGVPFEMYDGKTSVTVYNAKSDPTMADTDGDGINDDEDTAPWTKGDKDGYLGTLLLISCGEASATSVAFGADSGHAFLVYTSNINDNLDIGGFNKVLIKDDGEWKYNTESLDGSEYGISKGRSVTFGANGIADWITDDNSWGAFSSTINVEVSKYDNGVTYSPNAGISKKVTHVDVEKLMSYFDSVSSKKYSPITNQCAHIATGAWEKLFGIKYDPIGLNTPKAIKAAIEKDGGKSINLDSYIFEELS